MCTCVGTDTVFSALAGEGPTVLAGGAGDGAAGGDGGSSGKQRETGCQRVGLGAAANKRTAKLWPPRTMITPRWYRGGEQDAGKQAGRPDTRGQPTNKQQRMCGKWNFESSAEKRAKPSATNGVQAPPACLRPLPVTALRRSGSRPRKGEAAQTLRRQCYRRAEAMAAAAAAAAD